jgi:trigger factor
MQIQNMVAQGLKQEFKVTVPLTDIEAKIISWLQDKAKSVRLDGFRPGKAPLNILRQRYEEHALQAAREHFVQTGTQKIYKDNNVRAAGQPAYDFDSLKNDQDFSFSISFETFPSFELKDFSKIKLEAFEVKITPEEISKSLERLYEGHKKTNPDKTLEMNDDFAKEFGCESLEELREKIAQTLKNDYDRLARLYSLSLIHI